MPHAYLAFAPPPRVLAHRGLLTESLRAEGVAENSLAAIAAAANLQAAHPPLLVESDLHLTRDGEVVLFHDADLNRVLGDPRRIADVTVGDLRELMRGRGELGVLTEVLEAFPHTRFNLDVKAAAAAWRAGRIIAPHAHRVLLTSFDDRVRRRALQAAREAGGDPATSPGRGALVRVLLAVATGIEPLIARTLRSLDALQVPERQGSIPILSPRLIAAAHRHGAEVHVWTINDPEGMRELLALGVDGIVTDRADLALEVVEAVGR